MEESEHSLASAQVFGYAMGSRFEIMLAGEDGEHLLSAGNRALAEIQAVERQISHTIPESDIARVNAEAAAAPVPVAPAVFALLEQARRLAGETEGAFDVTAGALLRCWGFFMGKGRLPAQAEIDNALARCGWEHVHLDPAERTVSFDVDGVALQLGALGKGYALDRAAAVLRRAGVAIALAHGGGSSIVALGKPPDERGWGVGFTDPRASEERLGVIVLRDRALSVSGVQERFFMSEGRRYGHILDPRTGLPAEGVLAAGAIAGTGAETEALSTAFVVLGAAGARRYCAGHADVGAVLLPDSGELLLLNRSEPSVGEEGPGWDWEE